MQQTYGYIAYRKERGDTHRTVTGVKSILTHFNQAIGMKTNPALMVHLSKNERKTPMHLLDEEFLDTIYRETKVNTLIQKRNKCILGMIVFLGLLRSDIEALEVDYLDLDEARLYVPATSSRNQRYIDLNLKEMKDLMQYMYDLRPIMKIMER